MSTETETRSASERLSVNDRVLLDSIAGVQYWIRDVTEWGFPRFGELGMRLVPLRDLLSSDEQQRSVVTQRIVSSSAATTADLHESQQIEHVEIDRTHVRDRQQQLLNQLDLLITRLQLGEPAFCSWQNAVEQAEWIFHEACRNPQASHGD